MRIPRIYQPGEIVTGKDCVLSQAAAHHITHVLRMKTGRPLQIFNGAGGYYEAVITETGKRQVVVEIGNYHAEETESPLNLVLGLGVTRGDRMDFAVQKAAELGVHRIVPVICEFSNLHLSGQLAEKRINHWQKIIISACEQCMRNRLPELDDPVHFDQWITQETDLPKVIMHPGANYRLSDITTVSTGLVLLTGPEGGFSENEIKHAGRNGYLDVALGTRVLRSETAAMAAITACQLLWGDIR